MRLALCEDKEPDFLEGDDTKGDDTEGDDTEGEDNVHIRQF
jgi:hypothetical protein